MIFSQAHKDYIGRVNFGNQLIAKNYYPQSFGWVHIDGTIGVNSVIMEYPNIHEFIDEWEEKLEAFPYLDLVIAVTNWEEMPGDVR